MLYVGIDPGLSGALAVLADDGALVALLAQQLFPAADLRRRKDHNKAEALLLALYGQRHFRT